MGVVIILAFGAAGAGQRAVAEDASRSDEAGILDGKVLIGELGRQRKEAGDNDELRFQAGRFRSIGCDSCGFGGTPCAAQVEGDTVTCAAEAFSASHGQMVLKGTVRGETVEGTAIRYQKPGKAPEGYWFKVSLQPNA